MLALIFALAFFAAAAIDFAEVRHVQAVSRRDALAAGTWSLVMYGVGALGWVAVLEVGPWVLVPEALGFMIGSYLAVRRM